MYIIKGFSGMSNLNLKFENRNPNLKIQIAESILGKYYKLFGFDEM